MRCPLMQLRMRRSGRFGWGACPPAAMAPALKVVQKYGRSPIARGWLTADTSNVRSRTRSGYWTI